MRYLVHAWARDRLTSTEQDRVWKTTRSILALSLYGRWDTYGKQPRSHIHSYLLHLYSSNETYPGRQLMIASILSGCAWYILTTRDNKTLNNLLQKKFHDFDIDSTYVSTKSIPLLPLYSIQAHNLQDLGQTKKAVRLFEQVVKIQETKLSEDHNDRLSSQDALASAYLANIQFQLAVDLLEQVTKIRKTIFNEDHPSRLASQHGLARAYMANGEIQPAVRLLEQVVEIKEKTLKEDDLNRLASEHELVHAYLAEGEIQSVVQLLEHVVQIREKTLREDYLLWTVTKSGLMPAQAIDRRVGHYMRLGNNFQSRVIAKSGCLVIT